MDEKLLSTCSDIVSDSLEDLHEHYEGILEAERPVDFRDSIYVYPLQSISQDVIEDFVSHYTDDRFWVADAITDYPSRLLFAFRLLNSSSIENWQEHERIREVIQFFRESQTYNGEFRWREYGHTAGMNLFIEAKPNSPRTKNGVEYFLENPPPEDLQYELALGIAGVMEYDYYTYEDRILELSDRLAKLQKADGSFGIRNDVESTSISTSVLYRVPGHHDVIDDAVDWLTEKLSELSGPARFSNMAYLVDALMDSWQGPKTPVRRQQWEQTKLQQRMAKSAGEFVETYSLGEPERRNTSLREEIETAISSFQNQLLIISPYIDMLHEGIIDRTDTDSDLTVKIITRPKGDISGGRAKLAKAAVDQLNRDSNRHVRKNRLVHARLVVEDNNRVIVSSGDLTRDQLVDEYNAGVVTGNDESVNKAINFFESIWSDSEEF